MSSLRVLAFSSSRVKDFGYLETAAPVIKNFLGDRPLTIAFIPFADADNNYENYVTKVSEAFAEPHYQFQVVKPEGAANVMEQANVIEQADVIMVGGGNTFKLLHDLYDQDLVDIIRKRVHAGTLYIGWSAGSNIAGLSIGTTNDMPVIEPKSFKALGFFPFQINPHYINVQHEGHNGETRDERLFEYLKVNPKATIVGLPEGAALRLEGKTLQLVGEVPAVLFRNRPDQRDERRTVINVGADLSWLL